MRRVHVQQCVYSVKVPFLLCYCYTHICALQSCTLFMYMYMILVHLTVSGTCTVQYRVRPCRLNLAWGYFV